MAIHLNCITKKTKTKTYKYFELASSFRDKKGVPRKKKIEYLGVLSEEEEALWRAKLAFFSQNNIDEACWLKDLKSFENKHYLDVALLNHIYNSLGISKAFEYTAPFKDIKTGEVAKILTISRCLDPQAHYRTEGWLKKNFLPEIMGIESKKVNKDKIFKELQLISERKSQLQKVFLNYSNANSEGANLYFFDGTTSFFEGTECPLSTPGMDKTSGFQNNIFTICLVTDKSGVPIAWETVEGNKRDVTEFKNIGQKLSEELGLSNVTFCFDRGVASQSNFELIDKTLESKFISGLDKNQISAVYNLDNFVEKTRNKLIEAWENIEENKTSRIIPINGFYRRGHDRFYCELGINEKNQRRHIVSFNINIFKAEQERRKTAIQSTIAKLEEINNELKHAKIDRDADTLRKNIDKIISKNFLQKIIEVDIIPIAVKKKNGVSLQSHNIKYSINENQVNEQSKLDGILIYTTNNIESKNGIFEVSAANIMDHYSNKYVIESAFRHLKSFLDLRPVYVRKVDHVRAHVDICMTSYFINNHIRLKLKEMNMSIKNFYSLLDQYSIATRMGAKDNHSVFILNQLSDEMKQVLKCFNDDESILNKINLQKLNIQL